ncbi:succinate dehydrogenase assembly factor 2 [Paracidovorax sp. MALMAid1276]|uniref:FAD assembly factor SdhE n=1 Tax=Paracidovorax sp. MALMAid1276 TaxID=3411631 RepID=UPI003B9CA513
MSETATPALPSPGDLLDERERAKLHWRCRRGLLENDLYIENFFARHGAGLTWRQAHGMNQLMDLADNDLLDLVLARREPEGELDTEEVREVLGMLRLGGGAARPRP